MRRNNRSALLLIAVFALAVLFRGVLQIDPFGSWIESLTQSSPKANSQYYLDESAIISDDLKAENSRLRQELQFAKRGQYQTIGADVVNKSVQTYRSAIRVNRGSDDGVMSGQAVLAGGYLVGYVGQVDSKQSSVVLIGDPEFRATAIIGTTNLDGIVLAKAGGVVIDELQSGNSKITGKRVLTSGVGELFPPGLTLGVVGQQVSNNTGIFQTYILDYPLNIASLREVLILK